MPDVVRRFGTSEHRCTILRGLLHYRTELRRIGVARAFQWLDGSFVENIPREPNDIDAVTFAEQVPRLGALQTSDQELFDASKTKQRFSCDAYLVQLAIANRAKMVERVAYWYGLFSHRRVTFEWKGIVQVDLDDARQDTEALVALHELDVKDVLET